MTLEEFTDDIVALKRRIARRDISTDAEDALREAGMAGTDSLTILRRERRPHVG